jgi:signal transduction histidine kinase/CheY-like chemotaxis protein
MPSAPYLALGVSLLVTFAATWYVADNLRAEEQAGFQRLLQRTRDAIDRRLELYIAYLRATRSLFLADGLVTRQDFHLFVDPAELQRTYRGIHGVGVSRRILGKNLDQFVEAMRKEIPGYRLWPAGQRDEYEPVIYLEPTEDSTKVAMGYDMLSEPARRSAMERARDTGVPSSTGKIVLVYDKNQAGFIIYVARYRRGMPTATAEERRAALEGFVYASFRANELLQAILANEKRPGVRYAVFDGANPKPDALLYRSDSDSPDVEAGGFQGKTSFEVAGSTCTLSMSAGPGFEAPPGPNRVAIFLLTGLVMSGALFAVTRSEVNARVAAERAAKDQQRAAEQQRVLEGQLSESQKMEGIGRLAGGVAHDFNNLLTAILGYADLLESQLEDESLKADVREIRLAGDRATALTRQLLAFSRRQVLQPRTLDLNSVVSNIEKMLERLIGEDIKLVARLEPALGNVKADPGQLEQVITNLAVNARDAMPKGGTITFETANVALDPDFVAGHRGAHTGPHVVLKIADTGTGMSEEVRGHAFEPFFTTKARGKGTGLGLATAYGIVKQSGGYITVDSEPGRGTTFRIYLPLVTSRVEASEVGVRPAETSPRGSETILLVEDESSVRGMCRTILRALGYTVLEAVSGDEALEVARSYTGVIHLVVTDVIMPGMSGSVLWDRLRELRRDSKVLFMSGYTDDAIASHGVLDPGIAFLQKPFTPQGLAEKVRDVLDAALGADT